MKYLNAKILILKSFSLMLFFLVGCEDVITLDLENSDPQIVIEANISDQDVPAYVKISKSTDYFNPDGYTKVSNAEVIISDQEGNSVMLFEQEAGLYFTNSLSVDYNSNYSLKVIAENQTFNATTTLVEPIAIDSLSYESETIFDEKEFDVFVHFQDTKNEKEFLIFEIELNDDEYASYQFYEDRLSDGNYLKYEIIDLDEEELLDGINTIEITTLTVNEQTYNYYKTLAQVLIVEGDGEGNSFSPSTPENPESNIDNNALGFFGAYSVSENTIEIIK